MPLTSPTGRSTKGNTQVGEGPFACSVLNSSAVFGGVLRFSDLLDQYSPIEL